MQPRDLKNAIQKKAKMQKKKARICACIFRPLLTLQRVPAHIVCAIIFDHPNIRTFGSTVPLLSADYFIFIIFDVLLLRSIIASAALANMILGWMLWHEQRTKLCKGEAATLHLTPNNCAVQL